MHGTPDFLCLSGKVQRVLGAALSIDKRDRASQQHDFPIIIKKLHLHAETIGNTGIPAIRSRNRLILLLNLNQPRV